MAKDDPKAKKPIPKGSNIPTVLGIPAIPDPRIEPKVEPEPELIEAEPDPDPLAATVAAPPPTDPRIPTPPPAFEPALAPPTSIVETAKKKWRELVEGPRPRLYAFVGIGGLVVLIFVGVVIRLASGSHEKDDGSPIASASAPASATAAPLVASEAPIAPPPVVAPPKDPVCSLGSSSHVISPRAIVSIGIDIAAVEDSIALGFASAPKEASIALLDPATAASTKISKIPSHAAIVRVSPRSPVTASWVSTDAQAMRPIGDWDVGGKGSELVWKKHDSSETKTLWKLESDAAVEALRGVPTSDGVAVAYRHAGAIWVGSSSPTRVPGLGPQVGSPAIARSGDNVLVAWADRAEATQPWGLRVLSWHLGADPKPAQSFTVPAGGPGENAMAPSIAGLANGFLLVWTEGPMDKQQVRAQVLRADGSSHGDAIRVSPDGIHAGQGQATFLGDGRGVVAFLADAGKAFELRATTMKCD